MKKTILLANRPDLVLKLEKYDLIPEGIKDSPYEGIAKKWAKDSTAPYDTPEYRALAERLPTGWEELTQHELKELLQKLDDEIEKRKKGKLDTDNKGSENFLKGLTQVAFLGMTGLGTLLIDFGIGILPEKDEKEKKIAKELAFELVLHLLKGAKIIEKTFQTLAETTNASEEDQELIREVLTLTAFFLAIASTGEANEEKIKRWLFEFKTTFTDRIAKIDLIINKKMEEQVIDNNKVALFLQQLQIALKREDYEGFEEAFTNLLGLIQATHDQFNTDIKEIQQFVNNLQKMIHAALEMETKQTSQLSQAM